MSGINFIFGSSPSGTSVFLRNRTSLTLAVEVRQEGDSTLTEGPTARWTRGATIIAPGRRERVVLCNYIQVQNPRFIPTTVGVTLDLV